MTETCTIFDGLDGLDCENEADEYGLCERHGGFTDLPSREEATAESHQDQDNLAEETEQ